MTSQTIHCANCGEGVEDGALFCPHCGEAITYKPPDVDPFVGRMVSQRYTVVERIARGGMGEVYLARHAELNQHVAVKFLHRRFADDEEFAARFFNEARSACRVNHPNAVSIYDFGRTEDGTLYIVMEFIEGVSLQEMIKRDGRLETKQAIRVAKQACEVLASAHAQSIIHRDVKPDNLMVMEGPTGRLSIKMLDFGIAKILDEESAAALTQTGVTFGTPEYMSPEQASGRDVDERSDVYSLGVVLYATLVGHPPFRGKNKLALLQRHIRETPPRLDHACSVPLPPSLVQIVEDALEKDPDKRPQSMAEMLARLEQIDRDVDTGAMPVSPAPITRAEKAGGHSILTHHNDEPAPASTRSSDVDPVTEGYELGTGSSLANDDYSLGTVPDGISDSFSFSMAADFDDDPYAAPLPSGSHPTTGPSRATVVAALAVVLVGLVIGANTLIKGASSSVPPTEGSAEVATELPNAGTQMPGEGSGEHAELTEGSGEPPAPNDEAAERVASVITAIEEGEIERAQRLIDALSADGAGEFQAVQNAQNRLDAVRGLQRRIDRHLAAAECVPADTLVIELRDTYSRPAAMAYYGRLDACRDAAQTARQARAPEADREADREAEPEPEPEPAASPSGRSSRGRTGPPSEL